ncbi:MAG: alcohol dehydrogenase catalytic domain-containing protein, partial [Christensenellaceae bacterium]|nr:alcohol dehydrogenase catalytic domain-containing protein [Christensenellaceae bacterium]
MKTKGVRLYGANDLKLDTYEVGPIGADEILAHVVCDSICMSTYKGVVLGAAHKRIPEDVAENPVVMGHEFTGTILEVGEKWQHKFAPGMRFAIQPNINSQGKGYAPGYSFGDFGGNAQFIRIPGEVMEKDALLPYTGDAFFKASLAEPLSCIIGAFKASFHYTAQAGQVTQGYLPGGTLAILGGTGPMGLCAIDYALSA